MIERQECTEEVEDDVWIVARLAKDRVEQSKYRRTCVPAGTKIYLKCNGMQGGSFYEETVEECVDHEPQVHGRCLPNLALGYVGQRNK